MLLQEFPWDLVVLSVSYGWVHYPNEGNQYLTAYFLCLVLVLCSVWIEVRLKWMSRDTSGKNISIVQSVRSCQSSGSWYGVIPLFSVIAGYNQSTNQDLSELSILCLIMMASYLTVLLGICESGKGYLIFLILCVLNLGVLSNRVCSHGMSVCLVGVVIQLLCFTILRLCLLWAPGCFTIGEGLIVSQLLTFFTYRVIKSVILNLHVSPVNLPLESQVKWFAAVVFLGVLIIITLLLLYRWWFGPYSQSPGFLMFYLIYLAVIGSFVLPTLTYGLNLNAVTWLLLYLIMDSKRCILFVSWVLMTLLAVLIVLLQSSSSSVTRKYFHGLVVAVYGPGLLLDPSFLNLASVIALAVLITLEAVRVLNIPPLGACVHELFKSFCDEKDTGPIIVSHLYLLVGLSLPVWITWSASTNQIKGSDISLFSGLICLGVGDTAASIGGTLCGRHRWPGSKKTLEGTSIAIVCQLICILALYYLGMEISQSVLTVVVIVISTSFLEGLTSQIDNLILPVYMYTLLTLTAIHSKTDSIVTSNES